MQKNINKITQAPQPRSTAVNDCLQQALAERERLLERQPHLRAYQAEIDRVLDGSGNTGGRMAVLGTLLQGKLLEMQRELCKLTEILQRNTNSQQYAPDKRSSCRE